MFTGFLAFLFGFVLLAVLIGAFIATAAAGVTSTNRWAIVVGTVMLVGLGAWLAQFVVRRAWRPVRDLTQAAGRLADGDYTARVDGRSSPGMRGVVASFNTMAGRLEDADDQRRQLMSDLGHELRTPLAVIRGEIEAVIDGVRDGGPEQMASLLDDVEVLERLIEDLRILTLSESGALPLQTEMADLGTLMKEVATSYRSNGSDVRVEVELPTSVPPIEMDPVRIRQAVTNLVINSLRAMPGGGLLTMAVSVEPERITTRVTDTGSGIEPSQLPEVFGRFVKSDDSPGSGLGLSIARGLVRAHGGDLTIEASGPEGTTVAMWLPR